MKTESTDPPIVARPPPPGSPVAGKAVVVGVLLVAVLAASFALWWNVTRGQRSLAFWGAANVRLIQQGKKVELLVLEPRTETQLAGTPGELIEYGPHRWAVTKHIDLSQARGLVHARHALTDDASFGKDAKSAEKGGIWSHAVRFGDAQGTMLILMDFPGRRFANFQSGEEIEVIPKIAEGWQSFVERQK